MHMTAKTVTDILLLLLFILLMAAPHTGNSAHEWLGLCLAAVLLMHTHLNIVWYKTLFKGRYNAVRLVRLMLNAMLVLFMLGTLASAVPISRTLFSFAGFRGDLSFRTMHVFCAHWSFILAAVHLGMYGKRFRLPPGLLFSLPRPLGSRLATSGLSLAFALYGVRAFFRNELFFPLTMQSSFMLWSDSAALFILDYASIFFLFLRGTVVLAFPAGPRQRHAALFCKYTQQSRIPSTGMRQDPVLSGRLRNDDMPRT